MGEVLLIRTDAGLEIGMGHAMRCLALAEAWQDAGGSAVFAMAHGGDILAQRLHSEKFGLTRCRFEIGSPEDGRATVDLAGDLGADWIVVDGYQFGSEYQRTLKERSIKLLVIDDEGKLEHYTADIVLNQNLHAEERLYPNREPYTRLLLNTRYCLLRREFVRCQNRHREVSTIAGNVLVTMGGSDAKNITWKVLQALDRADLPAIQITVVVGGTNPHAAVLEAAAAGLRFPVTIKRSVEQMPGLLECADVAISAGGSSCWELAYMGIPSVLLELSENQGPVTRHLDQRGAAWNMGPVTEQAWEVLGDRVRVLLTDGPQRAGMASAGRALVDGEGARRVVEAICSPTGLRFRAAVAEDCRLLWEWANDTSARAVSFSTAPIPWEDHVRWFRRKLEDPDCLLLVAEDAQERPVGSVRFDLGGGNAVISVNLCSSHRGKGLGAAMIRGACEEMLGRTRVERIRAYIKPDNTRSVSAFARAAFTGDGRVQIQGQQCLAMVLNREAASL